MLYPQENEFREIKNLSGWWKFKLDKKQEGLNELWYLSSLEDSILIPVPSNYKDFLIDRIKDYVGDVWYEREIFLPEGWKSKRIFLRFNGSLYETEVWLNGIIVGKHTDGFYPFELDITDFVFYRRANRLTLRINNEFKFFYNLQNQNDFNIFYNCAGLYRDVLLYAVPLENHIKNLTVKTDVVDGKGMIQYVCETFLPCEKFEIRLFNKEQDLILTGHHAEGAFVVPQPYLWSFENPYLYTLQFNLLNNENNIFDRYRLPVGIKSIKILENEIYLNGKKIYLNGLDIRENKNIRYSKTNDNTALAEFFDYVKSNCVNSVIISLFLCSEEFLNLADEKGLFVIERFPELNSTLTQVLIYYKEILEIILKKDINHPSLIMWQSPSFFEDIKKIDPLRPAICYINSLEKLNSVQVQLPLSVNLKVNLSDVKEIDVFFKKFQEHFNINNQKIVFIIFDFVLLWNELTEDEKIIMLKKFQESFKDLQLFSGKFISCYLNFNSFNNENPGIS